MPGRALVLGGGGLSGIAWEVGMLAGLADAGIDLVAADVVIGTSAGSVVGAQLTNGVPLASMYEAQLADASGEIKAAFRTLDLVRFVIAAIWPGSDAAARSRLGHLALRAHTVSEAERRAVIGRRLAHLQWPERPLLVTAVDAETGEPRVFDRASGVLLVDAVGASCAVPLVWPPVTIGDRRYIDGGVRSVANADLASGCDRVVVLAPITRALRRSGRIRAQLASLGASVRSIVVAPDAQAQRALGPNVLDPAYRAASARAGRAQAAAVAARVREVWLGAWLAARDVGPRP